MPYGVLTESTAAAAFSTTQGAPLTSVGETLLSIRSELLLELGSREDATTPRLDKWINWGYRNVTQMITLKELFASAAVTVVASQPFYLVPVQVAWVKRLSVADTTTYPDYEGRELAMIDEAKYRVLPVETGEPTAYFRWRRMLVVWPTPQTARTMALDFRIRPDDMTLDTHSPILPPEFHEAILLSARHRALRSLQDYKQASQAYNDFLVCIRPLLNTDAEETVSQNGTMFPARSRYDLYRGRA